MNIYKGDNEGTSAWSNYLANLEKSISGKNATIQTTYAWLLAFCERRASVGEGEGGEAVANEGERSLCAHQTSQFQGHTGLPLPVTAQSWVFEMDQWLLSHFLTFF